MTKSFLRRCVIALVLLGGSQTVAESQNFILKKGLEFVCPEKLQVETTSDRIELRSLASQTAPALELLAFTVRSGWQMNWSYADCAGATLGEFQTIEQMGFSNTVVIPQYVLSAKDKNGCGLQLSFFFPEASEDLEIFIEANSSDVKACWYQKQ